MQTRGSGGPWRIEWRVDDRVTVIALLAQGFAHHTALEPFVTCLQRDGHHEGVVVLIDEANNEVVTRRRLDRPVHRATAVLGGRSRRRDVRRGGSSSPAG